MAVLDPHLHTIDSRSTANLGSRQVDATEAPVARVGPTDIAKTIELKTVDVVYFVLFNCFQCAVSWSSSVRGLDLVADARSMHSDNLPSSSKSNHHNTQRLAVVI